MKQLTLITISFIIILMGCSTEPETPPPTNNTATGFVRGKVNGTSWFADNIEAYRQSNTLYVNAVQNGSSDPMYTSTGISLTIDVNQTGLYGIGEDGMGLNYVVSAEYTLKSASGNDDKVYTAQFQDYSFLDIIRINDNSLKADYIFRAFADSLQLDEVEVTEGAIDINFNN